MTTRTDVTRKLVNIAERIANALARLGQAGVGLVTAQHRAALEAQGEAAERQREKAWAAVDSQRLALARANEELRRLQYAAKDADAAALVAWSEIEEELAALNLI